MGLINVNGTTNSEPFALYFIQQEASSIPQPTILPKPINFFKFLKSPNLPI